MAPLQDVRNLQFRVDIMTVQNGRKLRGMKPDENGFYNNVPLTCLGTESRNRTAYDVASFVRQIRDPSCVFNELLTTGQMYGELGHPNVIGLKQDEQFQRLLKVDEDRVSHLFGSIYTGKTLENGGVVLEGSVRPHGKQGQWVKESLEDPYANTAFSLRAITETRPNAGRGGVPLRYMKKLVTFDYVGAGGYREASKVYSSSVENFFSYEVDLDGITNTARFDTIALESFSDQEINEIFGAKTICRVSKVITFAKPNIEDQRRFGNEKYLRSVLFDQIRG